MKSIIALLTSMIARSFQFSRRKRSVIKRLLKMCNGCFVRTAHGPWMVSPGSDRTVAAAVAGDFQDVTSVIQQLTPGMAFIDVGANAGIMSLIASPKVGSSGVVVAFEPSLREFTQLVRNLAENGCGNVIPFMLAIGEKTGLVHFELDRTGHSGLSHLTESASGTLVGCIQPGAGFEVLEALIGKRSIMLKIDVEGAEMLVLRGLRQLILNGQVQSLIIETKETHLKRFGATRADIYAFMADLQFKPTRAKSAAEEGIDDEVFVKG